MITHRPHRARPKVTIPAALQWLLLCALAMGVVALAVTSTQSARAAGSTVTQCDGVDNQGGRTVHCTVEVAINGTGPATVTVTSCTGAGTGETCIGPTVSTQSVTAIDQCNGSGNGGGAIVKCDVIVTGALTSTGAVTISQCVGSGQGGGTQPTTVCIPSSTPNNTSAKIQQCDSSGNGGGGTERVKCTVTPASAKATVPTIKQCNGSGDAGGALVTCNVTIGTAGASGTATAVGTTSATAAGTTSATASAGAGTTTPSAGGTPTGGSPGTPGTGGTGASATPPIGAIVPPDTGSGPSGSGNGNEMLLAMLALVALGGTAIGSAMVIRRG